MFWIASMLCAVLSSKHEREKQMQNSEIRGELSFLMLCSSFIRKIEGKKFQSIFSEKNKDFSKNFLTKSIPNIYSSRAQKNIWRDGRAVECTGLENRQGESLPGFESLSLRHRNTKNSLKGVFNISF